MPLRLEVAFFKKFHLQVVLFFKAMKPICILVLILFFSEGCKQRKFYKDISGNFWSKQEDSTYFELYINDSEFVINHESYGPIPRKYKYLSDSIYIFNFENVELEVWRIVDYSDSILVLGNQQGEYKLKKMNLPKSYFESYKDSLYWGIFKEEFHIRYMKKK